MINYRSKINKILATIFMVGGFFIFSIFLAPKAQAAASSTLGGLAYWGINGYVAFDCANDVMGDQLDHAGNLYSLPTPRGFHFYAPPCVYTHHAVYIDSDNNFGGQAWNQQKGFISFSGTSTPPDGYSVTSGSGHCANTCNASNNCWACYNETEQKVYGWARVDSTGEWIRLDSGLSPAVRLQTCGGSDVAPGLQVSPGDFIGYASSSLGSLSFNCKTDTDSNACATRNYYKVSLTSLSIGSLKAPQWYYSDACSGNALGAKLSWCVRSGAQAGYEIVVNDTNYGTTPSTSTAFCWTGIIPSSSADNFYPHLSCVQKMQYAHNYYWWIRLYDSEGVPTSWYQYYGNSTSDTDKNIDNNVKTFTTYQHEFPTPFFVLPNPILVGTSTTFISSSTYFDINSHNIPQACTIFNCHYVWATDDANAIISATTSVTTGITFNSATSTHIYLTVTDNENYSCSMALISSINYDLPVWREIKAK